MMSNELLQMLDKCNDQRTALAQKNKQLKQRIADLEAQLEAAQGWVYVEDGGLPPEKTLVQLTLYNEFCDERLTVANGYYFLHDWFWPHGRTVDGDVIAWKLAPHPAPLRTAANVEEPTP